MNRIRQTNEGFQLLCNPKELNIAPDNAFLMGNFDNNNNFTVLTFPTLQEAHNVALNYYDIQWSQIVKNHYHVYHKLNETIRNIVAVSDINADVEGVLMNPDDLKDMFFERALNANKFEQYVKPTSVISFRISNPWTPNLAKLVNVLANYREHAGRDDLRIREQNVFGKKIFILKGVTDIGTVYEIKFVPSLLKFWCDWKVNRLKNTSTDNTIMASLFKQQESIDKGTVLQ